MDKGILNKNIDVIRRRFGDGMADAILDCSVSDDVIIEKTKNNYYAIKVKLKDKTLYLNSRYEPTIEAQRFCDKIGDYNTDAIFFVFGFACGYHIADMLKNIRQNKIIVIEPDLNIFRLVLERVDLCNILSDEKLYLVVGDNMEKLRNVLIESVEIANVNSFKPMVFSQYDRAYSELYKKYIEEIRSHIKGIQILINTTELYSYDFVRNFFYNLNSIILGQSIAPFCEKFKNKPAIIVSAGPSLQKNIKDLHYAKDKAIIMSGGRTLNALINNGINPDLIVTMDPGIDAFALVKGNEDNNVPMITTVVSYYEVVEKHLGKEIFLTDNEYFNIIKHVSGKELIKLPQGGSVAHLSLSIADYLGCNPIIFIGQDLAYTGGRKHAENSQSGEEDQRGIEENGLLETVDINGDKIYSSVLWISFARWFERYFYIRSEKKYINATEGGIRMEHCETMTLLEAINKYCTGEFVFKNELETIFNNLEKVDVDSCINKLYDMKELLLEIRGASIKGIKEAKKMLGHYECNSTSNINSIIKSLDKVDNLILKHKEHNEAFNDLISPTIVRIQTRREYKEKVNETEKQCGIRIAKKSIDLYTSIKDAIEKIPELIDESIKRILNDFEEYKQQNNKKIENLHSK